MSSTLILRDKKTRQLFDVPASENCHVFKTNDGMRVRVYPQMIKLTIRVGQECGGHTLTGVREMERVK